MHRLAVIVVVGCAAMAAASPSLPLGILQSLLNPFASSHPPHLIPNSRLLPLKPPSSIDTAIIHDAKQYMQHVACPYAPTPPWSQLIHVEHSVKALPYLIALDHPHQRIVIAFRGAIHLSMKYYVAKFSLIIPRILQEPTHWSQPLPSSSSSSSAEDIPKVHLGFWFTYNLIRTQLLQQLTQLVHQHPSYSFFIVGYSFGGAPAAFLSLDVNTLFPQLSRITVTFGALRLGNPAFARFLHHHLAPDSVLRVTHSQDLLVHLFSQLMF